MRKGNVWDDPDRLDELKRLHAEGFSCGMIARKMNLSRSTVIGKVYRLKLIRRVTVISARNRLELAQPINKQKTPRPPKNIMPSRAEAEALGPLEFMGQPITMLNAPRSAFCRFPYGEGENFAYCGRAVERGPYCAHHAVICLQPKEEKKKA